MTTDEPTERVIAQSTPPSPMIARGKFPNGDTHEWDVIAFVTIERSWDGAVQDTTHDALIVIEEKYVGRFLDAIDDIPDGDRAEWEIVRA